MADLKKIAQQFGEKAAEMLRKIDTPEKAIALKGEERAKYLEVLDNVFGSTKKRAADMGEDLDKLQEAQKRVNKVKEKFHISAGEKYEPVFDEAGEIIDERPSGIIEAMATTDKDDVGFAFANKDTGKITEQSDYGDYGVLVNPKFRGQGIAEAMYNSLEKELGVPVKPSGWQTDAGQKLWQKKDAAFGNKRHAEAAFDPRFKDSDLILAANSEGPKSLKEVAQKYGSKAIDLLSLPQRMAMNKAAQVMGLPGSAESSEESAAQISDKLVDKIVPANSEYLGPALKAAGTAGLEVFGDPTGALGKLTKLGKLAKLGATAKKIGPVVEPTVEGIYKAIKPVRATEDINIVKNAAETYVGRKGLAEKKALGQLDAAPKMPENIPPALMAEAEQKAAAVYADELAAAQGNPMALKSLENRIETYKRLYIKPRM